MHFLYVKSASGLATLVRYLIASVGALAMDYWCFLVLLGLDAWAAPASAVSYSAGIAVHWNLSSRAVFSGGLAEAGSARHRQKALFLASALLGLMLTTTIVWSGGVVGVDPRIAKLVAIVISFVAVWLLRSRIVFR
ncbi:GtrA family protein [Aurantiacibacter spongiae]|uniref:GtrA family protein n=1 Tax=Aurantiacibacter spongiae TaxID=2488860 RepID=A0A3N5DA01_9SPHN|nr:GtrA family protein [Aurantiacibacter spongiae]RPF71468.1 GtrA family protein [Aurantiacibacter spongiae]